MIALPIDPHIPNIVARLKEAGSLVLCAQPGAGKTTRVPRALLESDLSKVGEILVVQPRRLATRMAAKRVADEFGERLGQRVGYRIRFDRKVSERTRLTFLTEGMLVRRLATDPTLAGVSVLVFDEFHERHLDADLALATARQAQLSTRPDLRILVMSATLEAAPVADYLSAEIIEVAGRAFPVEAIFAESHDERPLERQVRAAVVRLLRGQQEGETPKGDILVFLPGAAEIRRALESLSEPAKAFGVDLCPLHGDLPADAQDRAVRAGPRPKVILSTNVAETSLTIESVVAVVDSGLARVSSHSPFTGLSSLQTAEISQASAKQRMGRAGRTGPGRCLRLWTRAEHSRRPARDKPEILRADLTPLCLGLHGAGHDPLNFPYFEAPPASALRSADTLLKRLGALRSRDSQRSQDTQGSEAPGSEDEAPAGGARLTAMGRLMLQLPLHPRLCRVALEAKLRGLPHQGALLTALISERDIRQRSRASFGGPGRQARQAQTVGSSDLIERLDLLESIVDGGRRGHPSTSACRAAGVDPQALKGVLAAADQIESNLRRLKLPASIPAPDPAFDEEQALRAATFAGFPDRLMRRRRPLGRELSAAGGGGAMLDEQSVVSEATLLVAVEADQWRGQSRVSTASAVDVDLIMELFLDEIEDRRNISFDSERQRVVAHAELRYDGLLLEQSRAEATDEEAAEVLADAALAAGLTRFCDVDVLHQMRLRVAFAAGLEEGLPLIDDALIHKTLVSLCQGRHSFAELSDAKLISWIEVELGRPAMARINALAPTEVSIPGRRVPVNYEQGRPPWIASRLQDFFGAQEAPTLGEHQQPLILHLLAPNKRAVQVTTDLAGFWERHYPAIRRQLCRRYRRHDWPEDPTTALPGRRPRRRH